MLIFEMIEEKSRTEQSKDGRTTMCLNFEGCVGLGADQAGG
jgi:hypothetical protein